MIGVIEQLAVDFGRFAPEMVASAKTSLYRVYRDTRFSGDRQDTSEDACLCGRFDGETCRKAAVPDSIWKSIRGGPGSAAGLFTEPQHLVRNPQPHLRNLPRRSI